jgi:hypothetical protein
MHLVSSSAIEMIDTPTSRNAIGSVSGNPAVDPTICIAYKVHLELVSLQIRGKMHRVRSLAVTPTFT